MLDENTDTTLVEYLANVATLAKQPGWESGFIMERFILEYGTDFRPARRPRGVRKQKDKLCFSNSTKLAHGAAKQIERHLDSPIRALVRVPPSGIYHCAVLRNAPFMEEWKKICAPCKLPVDTSAQVSYLVISISRGNGSCQRCANRATRSKGTYNG